MAKPPTFCHPFLPTFRHLCALRANSWQEFEPFSMSIFWPVYSIGWKIVLRLHSVRAMVMFVICALTFLLGIETCGLLVLAIYSRRRISRLRRELHMVRPRPAEQLRLLGHIQKLITGHRASLPVRRR